MVTADGRLVRANRQENSDLFWALRGGGGNFGIVTEFELKLHPLTSVMIGKACAPAMRIFNVMRIGASSCRALPTN